MKNVSKTLLLACAILGFQQAQAESPAAVTANFTNVADIETVRDVEPKYPALAIKTGVEGYVVLSYDLNASGKPVEIEVVEEHPKRVFSKSAIRALKASRFSVVDEAGTEYSVEGLARRYDFQFPKEFRSRTARRR